MNKNVYACQKWKNFKLQAWKKIGVKNFFHLRNVHNVFTMWKKLEKRYKNNQIKLEDKQKLFERKRRMSPRKGFLSFFSIKFPRDLLLAFGFIWAKFALSRSNTNKIEIISTSSGRRVTIWAVKFLSIEKIIILFISLTRIYSVHLTHEWNWSVVPFLCLIDTGNRPYQMVKSNNLSEFK